MTSVYCLNSALLAKKTHRTEQYSARCKNMKIDWNYIISQKVENVNINCKKL